MKPAFPIFVGVLFLTGLAAQGKTVAEWKMDDTSGPLADSAGAHACSVSGLRYSRKPLFSGAAIDFSGANSLPVTSNASDLYGKNLSQFTLEGFFRISDAAAGTGLHYIAGSRKSAAGYAVWVRDGGKLGFLFQGSGGLAGTDYYGGTTVDDGQTHHFALVFERSGGSAAGTGAARLFIDGCLDYLMDNIPPTHMDADEGFQIGRRQDSPFQGYLDHIRFSDRALGPSEFLNAALAPAGALRWGAPELVSASPSGARVQAALLGTNGTVALLWSAIEPVGGWMGTNFLGSWNANSTVAGSVAGLSADAPFWYAFYATNASAANRHAWSPTQRVETAYAPGTRPELEAAPSGFDRIRLDWTNPFRHVTHFVIETWTDGGSVRPVATVPAATSFYVASGLPAGEVHFFHIAGSNALNRVQSAWSDPRAAALPAADRRQAGPSSRRTPLTITEIMYHPGPSPEAGRLEYIELFNSEPMPRDLSGWRIAGDVEYEFPPGTVLEGTSYLVVASDPAALSDRYGLDRVLGPFTGSLPADRGAVRLVSSIGANLLAVEYQDQFPWPVLADGAGHSLQLAAPDLGELSPQAWSASRFAGGSPGAADPLDTSPLHDIVLNEILNHADAPRFHFVELCNRGTQAVDVSGCTLSALSAATRHRIPDGTVLPPGGISVFTQEDLGFCLDRRGDTVFFGSPDGRFVIDAVRFGAEESGVSIGRFPDGAPGWHELAAATPGATNAVLHISDVVINEIMYHPISGDDRDEFVELHNRSLTPADISGWRFEDGIEFAFPAGTVIAPGGCLAVARDVDRLRSRYPALDDQNAVGNYAGSLSDRGERLALARPLDPRSPGNGWVQVDEVVYGDGDDWGRWADGGGSSLELADPSSDNRLSMNWQGSDESRKSAGRWTSIAETCVLEGGNGAADELHVFLMGAGECQVDDVVVRKAGASAQLRESFEAGANGWQFWGNHVRSSHEQGGGHPGEGSLHVRASGPGDMTGGNSKGEDGNPTFDRVTRPIGSGLAQGDTVTIECRARWVQGSPLLVLGLKGLWMEASGLLDVPPDLGTPGAPNSRWTHNAGPAVWDVAHWPVLPRASEPVRITCRAHDPDAIAAIELRYRIDPSPSVHRAAMLDDGSGADALARDGIYTASLPGQPSGTVLAFTIQAADARAAVSRFPAAGPAGAPEIECLIRFGETEPAGALGTYRIWMTASNISLWKARPNRSNEPLPMTFVCGANRVIHGASVRYRGNWRPFNGPTGSVRCSYALDFPGSARFLGDNEAKLDTPGQSGGDPAIQRERHGSWFANAIGLTASNIRFVHVFLNGSDRGVNGILNDKEVPGRAFVKGAFGDPDPLYFENTRFHTDQNRFSPLRDIRRADGRPKKEFYRWYFGRVSTDVPGDSYDALYRLVDALNTEDPGLYTAKVEAMIDLENWMGVFAVCHIIGHGDSISWRNSKNTGIYAPAAGRARTFIIDTDQSFGIGSNSGATEGLFTCNDAVIARMLSHPPFRRIFWRYVQAAVDGPMLSLKNDAEVDACFQALTASGAAPGGDSTSIIKSYVSARRTYLMSQLAAVNVPFRVTLNGGADFATNRNLVWLTGNAPLSVAAIAVGGVPRRVRWDSVSQWSCAAALAPGFNELRIEGLDSRGNPIRDAMAVIHITFTGTAAPVEECLAISEIMYRPLIEGAGFVEINNRSIDTAFDLSGYRLQGVDFDIPAGVVIGPGQSLLVAEDRVACGYAYGWDKDVMGQYAGRLQPDGETLTLLRPGASGDQVIDRVRYESSPPWPASANGQGASLQAIDLSRDNSRVSNWSDGSGPPTPGAPNSNRTPLPPYPPLWLNEVFPHIENGVRDSRGELEPWIELFNAGRAAVPLDGLHLSDSYSNPIAWAFPPQAVIQPGQFLVVIADGEPAEGSPDELHAGFRLDPANGTVVLTRVLDGAVQIVDYLNYGDLAAGHSYGDLPDGQPFYRKAIPSPTPGIGNSNTAWPALLIHEWMADNAGFILDPVDAQAQDWFEIHNPTGQAVDIQGWYLSDSIDRPLAFKVPGGYRIPAHGFLLCWADGEPEQNMPQRPDLHVSFKLDKEGEAIVLSAPDGTRIDAIEFGPQAPDLSEGRVPADHRSISILASGTPRASNSPPPAQPAFLESTALGSRIMLTLETIPNFGYAIEYQDRLGSLQWLPLWLAERIHSTNIVVEDVLSADQDRFYRAWRMP